MFLIGGAGGYVIHHYWISTTFSPVQRMYFKQYLKSSYRSYLSRARSHYTLFVLTVIDPKTKKEVNLVANDDQITPDFDELGRFKYDERHRPLLRFKDGIKYQRYFWGEITVPDLAQYEWFKEHFYEGRSIPDIWRPAWLGALLIFIFGTIALTILDAVAQRLYLKGEPIRGTRELSPKKYFRERRRETGLRLKSYRQGSEI